MTEVRRLLAVLLVLVLGSGVVACGSDSDSDQNSGAETTQTTGSASSTDGTEAEGIEGITWTLMNIGSDEGWATSLPQQADAPTIEFENGTAQIFAGCNSGSGEAEIADTTIEFGPVALTKKACDETADQIEALVAKTIKGSVDYEVNSDGNLVLDRAGTTLVFIEK